MYRGVEESEASCAHQQTRQVGLPGVTGNTPAPIIAVFEIHLVPLQLTTEEWTRRAELHVLSSKQQTHQRLDCLVWNNNDAALTSVMANVMGGQGTVPSSRQATTSNFVYEGASIVQLNGMLRSKCCTYTTSVA